MSKRKLLLPFLTFLSLIMVMFIAACDLGGGSGSSGLAPNVDCSLAQNQSSANCGALTLNLADATGDFVSYVVTVNQVTLTRSDGVTVNALPAATQVDFTQLVDTSQVLALTYIPSGTYVSMTMTVDYTNADIQAESATEQPVKLSPVDSSGTALGVTTLKIQLGTDNTITIQHDSATVASLDFDLAASNDVNLSATPPTVTVSPILYASANLAELPTSLAMGTLTGVDAANAAYTIDVQPLFYLGSKTFGSLKVNTSAATTFEINGAAYTGSAGIQALATLVLGTPTLAYGTYGDSNGTFTAEQVYAGSSVPGSTLDAVDGSVLARTGNLLTVRGVVFIHSTDTILYHSLVTVTLGTQTVVRQAGDPGTPLTIADISVGQRVELLGTLTNTDPAALAMDAGNQNIGYARLAPTLVSGVVVATGTGQVTLNLSEINHHPVSWYDFTGTGTAAANDADPANYEIDTGTLDLSGVIAGEPLEVRGFVQTFGQAPPDFHAETIGNYALSNAKLMVSWRPKGTTAPFSTFSTTQLIINLSDPNLGPLSVLRRGRHKVDLNALSASPLIVPPSNGLGTYALRQNGVVTVYVSFSSFVTALQSRMVGGTVMVSFFATGGYDNGTFTATRIAVSLK